MRPKNTLGASRGVPSADDTAHQPTSSGPYLDPARVRLYFWKRYEPGTFGAGLCVPSWRDFDSDRAAWLWATDRKVKRQRFPASRFRVVDPTFQATDRGF